MVTKSPSSTGRSTGVSEANRAAQAGQLLVDVGVGDLGVVDGDLEPVVVRQLDLRPHVDLGGEGELLAVGELGDVDLGLPEGLDLVLLRRRRCTPWAGASLTASSRTAPRPTRWSMIAAGTLPLRNPGMLTWPAIRR